MTTSSKGLPTGDVVGVLASIACDQAGLIRRSQARDAGVSERQIDTRLAGGFLVAVRPGIYRFAGTPVTRHLELLAAVFASGDGAVASHRAAATLHRTRLFEADTLEVTVPGRSRATPAGAIVHRTRCLPASQVQRIDGLPATSPARTIIDLAGRFGERRVERLIEEWLADRKVAVKELHAALADLGTAGRSNVRLVRDVLGGRVLGDLAGDSTDDALLGQVLAAHGFPLPMHNHLLEVDGEVVELDWAYVHEQVAVEVEGFSVHTRSRRSFERLLLKRRLLARTPWVLLEYTAAMVRERPSRVAHEVESWRRQRVATLGVDHPPDR